MHDPLLHDTLLLLNDNKFVLLQQHVSRTSQESAASITDHIDGANQFNDYGGLLSEGFVAKTERKGKRMSCFFGGDWKTRKRNKGGCVHLFIGDHINLH